MPQFSYDSIEAILGQLAIYDPASIDSLINTLPFQVTDVVTAGTATDGTYIITVVGEEGTFTATFERASSETDDQIAAALKVDWDSQAANSNIATLVNVTDTNTMTFLHAGNGYTVTTTAPSPGTLVATLVTDPNGVNIPLGVGVVSDDGITARLPAGVGDIVTDIWGIVVRNADLVQELSQPQPTTLEFLPAAALSVMRSGEAWVAPEVAVAVNDPVFVRVVATGTEQAGALSNVLDTDNVLIPGRWKTAAAAGELAKVVINLP